MQTGLLKKFLTPLFLICLGGIVHGQIDVQMADGFSITKVASDELATNIFCLTLNPEGQPVVSGPGYIKTLIDTDVDGQFDTAKIFANGPATGAQGMLFDGTDLLCTGDSGLLRFKDSNRDGQSDGAPETLMPIKTGGEHLAHALRRGPDGWLYLLAGNQTQILPEYFAGKNSPVNEPHAGFLMRISPDFKTREIVVNGFRNAYDFDFNSAAEIFVFDSDGERDITLPWYRPTRVFQVRPGEHAGWVSAGWKRPSNYFDMPTEIGALGRGSPTGVCCYKGNQFPADFQDAIFVADWTFGRIVVFKRDPNTRMYDRGSNFVLSKGQFGFAVTDLAIAKDGSLFASVGGRGTQGGVYRIAFDSVESAVPTTHPADENLRNLRALSGHNWNETDGSMVLSALMSGDEELQVAALETIVGREELFELLDETQKWNLNLALKHNLESLKPIQARLVFNIIRSWPPEFSQKICKDLATETEAELLMRIAGSQNPAEQAALLIHCLDLLSTSSVNRELVLRLAQLTMDGCGPAAGEPLVFHGYLPHRKLEFTPSQMQKLGSQFVALYELFKTDWKSRQELLRLMSMLGETLPTDHQFETPQFNSVIDEIHWLICAANIPNGFPRNDVTGSLLGLKQKLRKNNLETDRNWTPRIQEMARRIVDHYEISRELVESDEFGLADHAYLHDVIAEPWKQASRKKFQAAVKDDPASISLQQFRIITSDRNRLDRKLVRSCATDSKLRDESILVLAAEPEREDISLYKLGLTSLNPSVIKLSAVALRRVLDDPDPDVQVNALTAALRLGWDKQGVSVRDQLMLLLQQQTDQDFDYVPKSNDRIQNEALRRWREYLSNKFPGDARLQIKTAAERLDILEQVNWSAGDITRGQKLYEKLQCALCHDTGSPLGPRMEGVTSRFSKRDLFRSIAIPHEQVPERYRATVVETVDGLIYKGMVIYDSVDGLTLMEGTGKTIRINKVDIEDRKLSDRSVMPEGLLDEVDAIGFADLFAYLDSLTSK